MKQVHESIMFALVLAFIAIIAWKPLAASPAPSETAVDTAAKLAGKSSEVCVTNAAGGTTITGFTNRKAIELQNLGGNAIFCTVDGQSPLSTGALGRRIDATGGVWSLDAAKAIVIKCIAAASAQTTPACTQVTELR